MKIGVKNIQAAGYNGARTVDQFLVLRQLWQVNSGVHKLNFDQNNFQININFLIKSIRRLLTNQKYPSRIQILM